jgi:hypothetical protein
LSKNRRVNQQPIGIRAQCLQRLGHSLEADCMWLDTVLRRGLNFSSLEGGLKKYRHNPAAIMICY